MILTADVAVTPATYVADSSANVNEDAPHPLETYVTNCVNVSTDKFMTYIIITGIVNLDKSPLEVHPFYEFYARKESGWANKTFPTKGM